MSFQKIALYFEAQTPDVLDAVREAARILQKQGLCVFGDTERSFSDDPGICWIAREELFSACDLVLSFGGDGTLLSAARLASVRGVPILGVNSGHIGFLTALERQEIAALERLNDASAFAVEERMMLKVSCRDESYHALNEVCLANESALGVTAFDAYVDGTLIGHFRADGVIVASPTGSTAYSLSAGGSIVDPRVSCICVTPICAHSLLRARPLIEPPDAKITLDRVSGKGRALLCIDGAIQIEIGKTDRVRIEKSERVTRLLRLQSHNFCNVLFQKLNERDEA